MNLNKWCFFPGCTSTSKNRPKKVFISVPKNLSRKKKWFAAARRQLQDVSPKTTLYCCEDHFNLKEDMDNYLEHRLSKVRARMKPEAVPHIFTCQPDKNTIQPRLSSQKRDRKRKISEILEAPLHQKKIIEDPQTSTSFDSIENSLENTDTLIQYKSDFCCQANPVHYRSKAVQVSLQTIVPLQSTATSPIKIDVPTKSKKNISKLKSFNSESSSSSEIWQTTKRSSDSSYTRSVLQNKQMQFRAMFIDILERKLRMYTGVPKESRGVLDVLEKHCSLEKHFIYLTLYKIKTSDSFEKIGDLFGLSKTYASKIFQKSVIVLSHFLNELIFWPSKLSIKRNLPVQFRITFSNVQSIIDCLEIEIQKPSSAKQQALTWSDYKKCNTIKYLISSTPDSLIHFISKGYGGRASDVAIFDDCGFLDVLPKNSVVMADRGFKKIETFLHKKNCTLVRPPSVANKETMSREDVLLTKRIASVRIHIERVIKRIRDFKILGPHATVNLDLVPKLDNIIIIACAIINLQKPIIKQ